MSWLSRSKWGASLSPFGRGAHNSSNEVRDADFTYITEDDLAAHGGKGRHRSSSRGAAEIVDWPAETNPDRDTDVLVFKSGKIAHPVHFPAHSIREGDLKIGTIRQSAAKRLSVADPKRIRMFYKGKNLKFDDRSARDEGLRGDGNGSEILCVVGDANVGSMAPGAAEEDVSDDDDDNSEDNDSGSGVAAKKKPRKRGGKKSRKGRKSGNDSESSTPGLAYSNAAGAGAEYLPIPSHIPGPSSRSASVTPGAATPQTPIGKMDAIASKFHTELVPLCVQYMQNPPEEKAKREFEYKKLSETILAQVLLKLDGVETEGDPEARTRRKALVKEVQGMLNKLDEVVK